MKLGSMKYRVRVSIGAPYQCAVCSVHGAMLPTPSSSNSSSVCVCVLVSSGVLHQIDRWHCLPSAQTFAWGIPSLLQPGAVYSGILALKSTFAHEKSTIYVVKKGLSSSRVDEGRRVTI